MENIEFLNIIKARQSVRKFDNTKTIEEEMLARILEAGRLAPSACNSQPWTFILVDEPSLRQQVAKATISNLINMNKFTLDASALIVIVMEKPKLITQIGGSLKNKEYPLIDIGIAASQICLQAQAEGIGSCMIGWFDEKLIQKLLTIPAKKTIGLIIAIGHPIEGYKLRPKMRKIEEEVIRKNKY
jgi:nitroreductase